MSRYWWSQSIKRKREVNIVYVWQDPDALPSCFCLRTKYTLNKQLAKVYFFMAFYKNKKKNKRIEYLALSSVAVVAVVAHFIRVFRHECQSVFVVKWSLITSLWIHDKIVLRDNFCLQYVFWVYLFTLLFFYFKLFVCVYTVYTLLFCWFSLIYKCVWNRTTSYNERTTTKICRSSVFHISSHDSVNTKKRKAIAAIIILGLGEAKFFGRKTIISDRPDAIEVYFTIKYSIKATSFAKPWRYDWEWSYLFCS